MVSFMQRMPEPEARFDIRIRMPRLDINGRRMGFEAEAEASAEDAKRAKLVREARDGLGPDQRAATKNLSKRLKGSQVPQTLASARFMRDQRVRVVGAILKFAHPWRRKHLRTFCALCDGWEVPLGDLHAAHPRRFMEQLRSQLVRAGAEGVDGFLIAFLEAEFEPSRNVLIFHVHGLVGGEMIAVLEELRRTRNYRPRLGVSKPLQLNELQAGSRAQAASYLLKSFWRSRRIGPVGSQAKNARKRHGNRLPPAAHTQALLWLDRWKLGDLMLSMKCRASSNGIQLTAPIVNNAYVKPIFRRY